MAALAFATAEAASAQGRNLFLLTGTVLNDSGQTFPVRLYRVSSRHTLELFRTVVPGRVGLYEILDDTGNKIYVAFPFWHRTAPVEVSIIHKRDPGRNDVVTFNPSGTYVWPEATATAAGPGLQSYALFVIAPGPPPGVPVSPSSFLQTASLVAVAGDQPAEGPRVTRDHWGLYGHVTFYGSPGGPGVYSTPEPVAESGRLLFHLGGRVVPVDRAPPALTSRNSSRTVWILAADRRFLVSIPLHNGGGNYTVPATMYVHDLRTGTWRHLRSAGSVPQCRIFGPWLATRVRNLLGHGGAADKNPGHANEPNKGVPYLLPDVRDEFYAIDSPFYIPGIFTLDNLVDGRRITLDTHEEDSEILDVRKDGLVLYRVNDEIFSAQIEGDKLSAPTLVVKGEDVPEVHWAFWSHAPAAPTTSAKPSAKR